MRPGRAADHSPPSSAAVMEEYSYTSTHPLGQTGPVTESLYLLVSRSCARILCVILTIQLIVFTEVKVKAIPLQAWKGPEGSRKLSVPDFKTVDT